MQPFRSLLQPCKATPFLKHEFTWGFRWLGRCKEALHGRSLRSFRPIQSSTKKTPDFKDCPSLVPQVVEGPRKLACSYVPSWQLYVGDGLFPFPYQASRANHSHLSAADLIRLGKARIETRTAKKGLSLAISQSHTLAVDNCSTGGTCLLGKQGP